MNMNVKRNDNVFVLGVGWGQVTRVLPAGAGFFVKVGSTERQYALDGTVGGAGPRKVYYQDPVFIEPCQNKAVWQAYVALATRLYTDLTNLVEQGIISQNE
jgi:hypothetical protein